MPPARVLSNTTELAMLRDDSLHIAKMYDDDSQISIIELGSGSSTKTRILLQHFIRSKQKQLYYFPIDVSYTILYETVHKFSTDFPYLCTIGICSDYIEGIEKANDFIASSNDQIPHRKLILFLGSSIGNFEPKESRSFLKTIRTMEKCYTLLLGIDLHNKTEILEAAYNDKRGITAKFNLNLLSRINKELGEEFNLDAFAHRAFYNEKKRRIEMHLVSKTNQQVRVYRTGQTFSFKENETIHTENSYKYTLEQIQDLADDSGFQLKKNFLDKKKVV